MAATAKIAPHMFEVVHGTPKCRNLNQTGSSYRSRPHLPLSPRQGSIPWSWAPFQTKVKAPRLLYFSSGVAFTGSWLAYAAVLQYSLVGAIAILAFINVLLTAPMLYLAYVINFNFKLREGICWCLGKAAQAKSQWAHAKFKEYAKHVFFEWRVTHHVKLVVLNDGTQEIWNTTGDELGEDLSKALGLEGFTGHAFNSTTTFNSENSNNVQAWRREEMPADSPVATERSHSTIVAPSTSSGLDNV